MLRFNSYKLYKLIYKRQKTLAFLFYLYTYLSWNIPPILHLKFWEIDNFYPEILCQLTALFFNIVSALIIIKISDLTIEHKSYKAVFKYIFFLMLKSLIIIIATVLLINVTIEYVLKIKPTFYANTYYIGPIDTGNFNWANPNRFWISFKQHTQLILVLFFLKKFIPLIFNFAEDTNTNKKPEVNNISHSYKNDIKFKLKETSEHHENFFIIKGLYKDELVKKEDIIYIKADGNYIDLVSSKKEFPMKTSLKKIQSSLPKSFVRVHRSFIINIDFFDLKNLKDNTIVSLENHVIPTSKQYLSLMTN